MKSLNEQKVATKNQITSNKPDIIKNSNVLQGYIATSFNGGHLKPIAFAPIMAGTKLSEYRLRLNLKMLTPKTPVYQKLKLNIITSFVPNSRVWENWEKFSSQKYSTQGKINEVPNIGGKQMPMVNVINPNEIENVALCDTDLWRDSWVSTYLPRYQTGMTNGTQKFRLFPKYSILPLRGFVATYNDLLRNKEYDLKLPEYKNDTMSNQEYEDYIGSMTSISYQPRHNLRGRRQNSYYTDYRTHLISEQDNYDFSVDSTINNDTVSTLPEYLKMAAQLRNEATNAQLNDWDIIAREHGSKKLTQGKAQLISQREIGINYNSVTQSAYNINDNIQEQFQVLGEQGAYSYTEIDISLGNFIEIIEDGFMHIIVQATSDTVFETGFERQLLNVGAYDIYRPELKDLKDDVLYDIEKNGTNISNAQALTRIQGYKRKFSEYFKLPNSINGDITTNGYYITEKQGDNFEMTPTTNDIGELIQTESKRSFQFFEKSDRTTAENYTKNVWQDYTDLALNDNQAIKQELQYTRESDMIDGIPYIKVKGDNQLFAIGMQTMVADMPIDENIKNNYQVWGEV